jgi:hypothetical protein
MFESILCEVTEYDASVLEPLIGLAVEISREGREGKRARVSGFSSTAFNTGRL